MRLKADRHDLLNESIATAATIFIFLQLNILEFTKRLKDGLKILLRNVKMDVSNI